MSNNSLFTDNKIDLDKKMPVFFLGHGSPMIGIEKNSFTEALSVMGSSLNTKPNAILIISAHWLTRGSFVSITGKPKTIYDFYGFPEELYKVTYPAPGAPTYAKEVSKLAPEIKEDNEWGLDHGAWTLLTHMFPKADIPVFQLSIDFNKPMEYHVELSKKLKALREKGVLIIGSGNIVHNLSLVYSSENMAPYDWAIEFDETVKDKIINRDFDSLIHFEKLGRPAKLSIPTADHYIPLLYSLALADKNEDINFTYEEVLSSLSMRCLRIGQ
jgi:4,5-DOPA dioxygenase extradiol